MINLDLEKQINQQIQATIQDYLNGDALKASIQEKIDAAVGNIISNVAGKIYSELSASDDIKNHILGIIKLETNQHIHTQSRSLVQQELEIVPVKDIVERLVKNEITITLDKMDFPNESIPLSSIAWKPNAISGDYVSGGLIKNFSSTGIDDKATAAQLTILDDHVVVEGEFTALNITAADTITAKNLSLTGTLEIGTDILDHGPFSQMIQMHSQLIFDQSIEPFKGLLKDGSPIISGDSISTSVSQSNLRRVGNLQELNVLGDAKFSDTVYISSSGKVGINTDEPRGALTIWDEDSEVSFTKIGTRTMFVGSTRIGNLALGTNNQPQIILKEDIIEMNNPLRIMGIKFSVNGTIPDYVGEPNEVVFVLASNENHPKFYMCQGGNRWQAL